MRPFPRVTRLLAAPNKQSSKEQSHSTILTPSCFPTGPICDVVAARADSRPALPCPAVSPLPAGALISLLPPQCTRQPAAAAGQAARQGACEGAAARPQQQRRPAAADGHLDGTGHPRRGTPGAVGRRAARRWAASAARAIFGSVNLMQASASDYWSQRTSSLCCSVLCHAELLVFPKTCRCIRVQLCFLSVCYACRMKSFPAFKGGGLLRLGARLRLHPVVDISCSWLHCCCCCCQISKSNGNGI